MQIIPTSLSVLIRHFPGQRKMVEQLLQQQETFRLLCEDFCDSVRAMEYWRGSDAAKAVSICEEYADIIKDLSAEIAQWLGDHGARVGEFEAKNRP